MSKHDAKRKKNKKTKKKQQKTTPTRDAAISHKMRSRNSTVSVKAETAECLVARDSIIA